MQTTWLAAGSGVAIAGRLVPIDLTAQTLEDRYLDQLVVEKRCNVGWSVSRLGDVALKCEKHGGNLMKVRPSGAHSQKSSF